LQRSNAAGRRGVKPRVSDADVIGFTAGIFTTAANLPQVVTTWKRKSGEGLSFKMLLTLAIGLMMWEWYGVETRSLPILVTNGMGLALSLSLIAMKFRFDRNPVKD
jgi:MtN3 and saliva related transmembrane protein